MMGLTKGEASSATNPVLQFLCRYGAWMVNPYEATYQIDDIHDPASSEVNKVPETSLDLDDAPTGTRLGTGQFAIPTGSTASWSYGTHRVIIRYRLVAGGQQYVQEVPFEVLSSADFVSGSQYVGYCSTRRMYQDGTFTITGKAPETLHYLIHRASSQLEAWTQRFFDPRFRQLSIDGTRQSKLFLGHAIVAIRDVIEVSIDSTGAEQTLTLPIDAFVVYNRHLDGLLNPDDRDNPKLAVSSGSVIWPSIAPGYMQTGDWTPGRRNLRVTGIFGYTDPFPESFSTLQGSTPTDLSRIVSALVDRYLTDPTLSSLSVQSPGAVRSYRTRDQSISFFGDNLHASASGGWTGDAMLDQAILRYAKPARLDYDDRDEYNRSRY